MLILLLFSQLKRMSLRWSFYNVLIDLFWIYDVLEKGVIYMKFKPFSYNIYNKPDRSYMPV